MTNRPTTNQKTILAKRKLVRGFTLIEILTIVAILAVLSTISIQVFNRYKERQALDLGAQIVAEALREARDQTLDSLEGSSYGVHLASSTVTIFKGPSFSEGAPENRERELVPPVIMASTTLSGSDVVFERLSGATEDAGSLFISVPGKESQHKEIIIESTGVVYVEE